MAATIAALPSHQPASRMYQVMTAVAYYAGLRPSEVVMLRPRALHLPSRVGATSTSTEADIGWDETGRAEDRSASSTDPAAARRNARLMDRRPATSPTMNSIFRTRGGRRPTASNWSRALKRALVDAGCRPMRVYDCRHAAATAWLRAGVPLGDVAKRWVTASRRLCRPT